MHTLLQFLCISLRIAFRGFAHSIKTQNLSADQFFDIEIEKNTNSEKLKTKELLFQEFDSFEWWMETYSRLVRLRVSYSSP